MRAPSKWWHNMSGLSVCATTNIYLFITLRGCKLAVNLRRDGGVIVRSLFSAHARDLNNLI